VIFNGDGTTTEGNAGGSCGSFQTSVYSVNSSGDLNWQITLADGSGNHFVLVVRGSVTHDGKEFVFGQALGTENGISGVGISQ
jgi:hypothetical protein